mgnify:CR=1 FL=1
MNKKKMAIRYGIFILGLFFMGFGIALTAKSGLGTTPISSVPMVLSQILPLSFGTVAMLLSVAFVLIQLPLLGKDFRKEHASQLIIAPFFGYFIDLGLAVFNGLEPSTYWAHLVALLGGIALLSLGVYCQVLGDVIINPAESVVKILSDRTGMKFGNMKILFDGTLLLIAISLSLWTFGNVNGMREGTLAVAFGTGTFVKGYKAVFDRLGADWLYR